MILFLLFIAPILLQVILFRYLTLPSFWKQYTIATVIIVYIIVVPHLVLPDPEISFEEGEVRCGLPVLAAMIIRFIARVIEIALALMTYVIWRKYYSRKRLNLIK